MSQPDTTTPYRGRFAPSPTGPLHFGSLVGALASYLDARHENGTWLVRIEDIDPLREPPGAADQILRTLEAHGLTWDEPVRYQSACSANYEAALKQLLDSGHAYWCPCSRKELAANEGRHPFHCRQQPSQLHRPAAIRFRVEDATLQLKDLIQDTLSFQLHGELDDFVLKRKEGFYAYQLAVVVDDADQGITHVVRGSDLIDSLPWQRLLQEALGLPQPLYAHFPVITNAQGQKLSKQNHSPALDDHQTSANLEKALAALGLKVPDSISGAGPETLLQWAIPLWQRDRIPPLRTISELQLPHQDYQTSPALR